MHKNPSNLQEVRDNLAEASYTAWIDKNFVNRAVVVVNAMGKTINSVALEIKAAEMNKSEVTSAMLPPMKKVEQVKAKIDNK
jgi:anti-sigma28 factor (negative regulator of flagellin synthesis)